MTFVDAEGRLFGRWNFVDAVVVVLVLGLIPIGYAAYALFRTPAPRLTAVEPVEIVEGPNQRITIRGENLRPYLRISFGTVQGATYLFEDTTRAVVDLNPMSPGTYDVVLYDFGQERHRLPKALTIRSPAKIIPTSEVIVVGRFINLTKEAAELVKRGAAVSIAGEILDTAPARPSVPRVFNNGIPLELPTPSQVEVPAVMKMPCVFITVIQGYPECGGGDFPLRPNYIFTSTIAGTVPAPFQIDQVYGTAPVKTLTVTVTFTGATDTLQAMSRGDADLDLSRNPFSLGSRIESLGALQSTGAQGQRAGVLSMRAQQLPSGWWYGTDVLRVSGQIAFRTSDYAVTAIIGAFRE